MAGIPFTGTQEQINSLQEAYDEYFNSAKRSFPTFRQIATRKVAEQSNPAETVNFQIRHDLAVNTAPLAEYSDGNGSSLPENTSVPVTAHEHGLHTVITKRLKYLTIDKAFDASVADRLIFNMDQTVDQLVVNALAGASNKQSVTGGALTANGTADGQITAAMLADLRVEMQEKNVVPNAGGFYTAFVSPSVARTIQTDEAWIAPHNYVDTNNIYTGEIGQLEGWKFIINNRVPKTGNTHTSYFTGADALAEYVIEEPHLNVGGVVEDIYGRFFPISWYGYLGFGVYDNDALTVVTSTV